MRILAVDNEPLILSSLRRSLTRLGHQVVTASSGHEALTHLEGSGTFDLVMTDVDMPEQDGFTLRVAILARFADLPVLLVSGSVGAMEHALAAGLPFLAKPWSEAELEAALEATLAGHAAQRHLASRRA